jgi:microcin C transport system substrate-binding protein
MGLMFDFEWTNRTLFNGAYKRALSYYPNSEFSASGIPQGHEWLMLSPYRAPTAGRICSNRPLACRKPTGAASPAKPCVARSALLAEMAGNSPGNACSIAKANRCAFEYCW